MILPRRRSRACVIVYARAFVCVCVCARVFVCVRARVRSERGRRSRHRARLVSRPRGARPSLRRRRHHYRARAPIKFPSRPATRGQCRSPAVRPQRHRSVGPYWRLRCRHRHRRPTPNRPPTRRPEKVNKKKKKTPLHVLY